jgi:AbrB family looped-hinge helix DNA binding protein
MRVTSKGQVTIPVKIRDEFGIQPNTEVRFVIRRNQVVLEKSRGKGTLKRPSRGDAVVARMRQVARNATRSSMSTDEIMALTRGD